MARLDDLLGADHGAGNQHGFGRRHRVQDGALIGAVGIGDNHLHHEPVDLRLGQRIGPFLLQRILRGQHQERIGQRIGLIADRHLPFLHGLEQRALHFRRRAIDFVGQDEIAEYRTVLGAECPVLRVVDHGPDDVGGQHVGRELQPLEMQRDAAGQRLQRQGFGQAGHAFQQHVAVGQQRDQQTGPADASDPR